MPIHLRFKTLPELRGLTRGDRLRAMTVAINRAHAAGDLRWLTRTWAGLTVVATLMVMWFGDLHWIWIRQQTMWALVAPLAGVAGGVSIATAAVWPWAMGVARRHAREYLLMGA